MNRKDVAYAILVTGWVVSWGVALFGPRMGRGYLTSLWAGNVVLGLCAVVAALLLRSLELAALGLLLAVLGHSWGRAAWRRGR